MGQAKRVHSHFFVYKKGGFTSFNPPYIAPYICLLVGWIKAGSRIHIFMGIMLGLQKIENAPGEADPSKPIPLKNYANVGSASLDPTYRVTYL